MWYSAPAIYHQQLINKLCKNFKTSYKITSFLWVAATGLHSVQEISSPHLPILPIPPPSKNTWCVLGSGQNASAQRVTFSVVLVGLVVSFRGFYVSLKCILVLVTKTTLFWYTIRWNLLQCTQAIKGHGGSVLRVM